MALLMDDCSTVDTKLPKEHFRTKTIPIFLEGSRSSKTIWNLNSSVGEEDRR